MDATDSTSHFRPSIPLRRWLRAGGLVLALAGFLPGAWALRPSDRFGLKDLEAEPSMTPGRFADLFAEFDYTYYPSVQSPHTFLHDRNGDCDDYAILASHILRRNQFKTRLVRVELVGTRINHVVCYVMEKKAYLDYNNRKFSFNLERSGTTLRDIATKVADSFEKNWTTATEYTYTYAEGRQHAIYVVVKTDPPAQDPDRRPAPPPR